MSRRPRAEARPKGTLVQRLRVRVVEALSWLVDGLPERPLVRAAEAVGLLHYAVDRERALLVRRQMRRVAEYAAANNMGTPRVRAAATDPRILERLVQGAFRHHMRYYLELLRTPGVTPQHAAAKLTVEDQAMLDGLTADIRKGGVLGLALHYGAVELPARFFADISGRPTVAPMEAVDDPPLQDWFLRTRTSAGIRLVGLREAKREMSAALAEGSVVGMIGDRDITGGGIPIPFFGTPAALPVGIGLFLLEAKAPVWVGVCRRAAVGQYTVSLHSLEVPTEGTRRERVEEVLRREVAIFEQIIAAAPEQWWGALFPIWPDLDPAAERASAQTARHAAHEERRKQRQAKRQAHDSTTADAAETDESSDLATPASGAAS